MDNGRSGEVVEPHAQGWKEVAVAAHVRQPTVRSPSPVSDDRVNETSDADAVKKVADETSAADHGPGSDSRACIGEGELEDPDCQEGHAGSFIGRWCVLEEEPVITNEPVAVAKHECEPDGIEQDAAKACVHDTFHENVHGFAGATEAGFQHGEAYLHAEHKKRSYQCPCRVHRIDHVGGFNLGSAGLGVDVSEEQTSDNGHDEQNQTHSHYFPAEQRASVPPPFCITYAIRHSVNVM